MKPPETHLHADRGTGPLFMIGIWRSGTSLIYTLFNQHPEIALMYEGDLPLLQPLFSGQRSNRDWLARWEFWNSALSRHNIQADKIPAAVPDLRTGAMAVWKQYAGASKIMGEKSPDYYDSLQAVSQEFPDARFIIIWRNLADICRSIIRARTGSTFFSKPGLLHRAVIGYHKLKLQRDILLARGVPVHEIQYEEVVEDPARVMAGVCSFLGIPFDPRMATLRGADRSAIYDASHHEHVRGEKILNSRDAKEVLPPHLQRKIERYVAYWQEQSQGAWPRYPKAGSSVPRPPSSAERLFDELLFRALRMLDDFTVFVYCYAPFGWLQMYRSFKNRRLQNAEAGVQASRLTEPSKAKTL